MANRHKRAHPGRFKGRGANERGYARVKEHTLNRALERYGVRLDAQAQKRVVRDIEDGKTEFVSREPLHREIHVVEIDHVRMPVLYSTREKQLVSVLPDNHRKLQRKNVQLVDPRLEALRDLDLDLD